MRLEKGAYPKSLFLDLKVSVDSFGVLITFWD